MSDSERPQPSSAHEPNRAAESIRQLVDRLEEDQRVRWQRGERVLVEAYLEQHPRLQAQAGAIVDLLYNEFLLRQNAGEAPRLEDYLKRFPQLADQVRDQFEVHGALQSEQARKAASGQTTTIFSVSASVSPLPDTADLPVVPGYEIVKELGRGGMGVVYQARQMRLNRTVALKMILSGGQATAEDLLRFQNEVEAVAQFQHPAIVQVFESGQHNGLPFVTLEFVSGGNLADKLKGEPQPLREAARLVEQLARAVHYAHQRGIIHRDLKPANVLLTEEGEPKITDFGLAKRLDIEHGMTQSGAIVGTPSYMAPEQAAAKKGLTTAADTYSLGAILYEQLTGRPPFRGSTWLETVMQVLDQPPLPPRSLNSKIDRGLELICLKCLEKDPVRRYESAAALAEDLRRWHTGETLSVHPPSLIGQLGRWIRRNAAASFWTLALGAVWGLSVGVATALQVAQPETLQMWPSSLSNPLGWVKLANQYGGLGFVAIGLAIALSLGIGWLVVLLGRPKDRRGALAFTSAMALVATLLAFLFVGPFEAVADRIQFHPIEEDYHGTVLTTQRPSQMAIPPTDLDYLKEYLPPDKRNLKYTGWGSDILVLRSQARYANRLYAAFNGMWTTMVGAAVLFLSLGLLSTWSVSYLYRRRQRLVTMLVPYVELYLPAAVFVVSTVLTLFLAWNRKFPLPDLFILFSLWVLVLGSLVALTFWGVTRSWHWAARWAAYVAWGVITVPVAYGSGWVSLVSGQGANPPAAQLAIPSPRATPPPQGAPAAPAEPRAKEILDGLAKTYLGLQTYRDSAKGLVSRTDDRGNLTRFDFSSRTVFIRPDRLRIEYRSKAPIGNKDIHTIVWKRGNDLKRWRNVDSGLGEPKSLTEVLGGVAGGSAFIAHNVPHLLLGTKGIPPHLSELEGAKWLEDEKLGEITCQRVEGRSGLWTVMIWVDGRSGLLRRLDLKQRFVHSTTVFEPVADQPVPDEMLEFHPPSEKACR